MKVTREMLHPDLRGYYWPLRLLTFFMRHPRIVRFLDKLSTRSARRKAIEGMLSEEVYIPASDGETTIRARIYKPEGTAGELPLMLYLHGGGYIMGCPEMTSDLFKRFIDTRPCVIVAPDYRKAWTKPFPAGFDDCFDTLLWARENAAKLGARADRLIVAGHSAGGGLTAAVTLKARDRGDIDIAFQMPIYPMIDDSQPTDRGRDIQSLVWDSTTNRIGWEAYLADLREQGSPIPAYAAPARNTDYSGFPPTITFVGSLEPFFQETQGYVASLRQAGIDVAYKEYEGCFHAFELFAANKPIGRDGADFTFDTYADFYDRYIPQTA